MRISHLISFIIAILMLMISCNKRISTVDYHYISNYTNKKIIHQLEVDDRIIGYKFLSIYIDKPCIDSLEWTVVKETGRNFIISYRRYFYVYNLSDTTSIQMEYLSEKYHRPSGSLSHLYYYKNSSENEKEILSNYLIITDSFLTLFQKDTSMLTQFKDYYNP